MDLSNKQSFAILLYGKDVFMKTILSLYLVLAIILVSFSPHISFRKAETAIVYFIGYLKNKVDFTISHFLIFLFGFRYCLLYWHSADSFSSLMNGALIIRP